MGWCGLLFEGSGRKVCKGLGSSQEKRGDPLGEDRFVKLPYTLDHPASWASEASINASEKCRMLGCEGLGPHGIPLFA